MAAVQQVRGVSVCSRPSSAQALAPVRPSVAARTAFKSAVSPVSSAARASVVARAAAVDEKELLVVGIDGDTQASYLKLPAGYHWYETMMILNTMLSDEDRDKELAKFEAYLNKEECTNISALVRGRSRMAYPMSGQWEGIYVLYTYAAKRQTARNIQLLLSNPVSGSEDNLLRHITFCKY